jgi:hypothetical protein
MTAPLFRLANPVQGDHLYTTSVSERDQAVANLGYVSEGAAADVSATAQSGLVPLYRVSRTSGNWDRLYTTSTTQRDQIVASLGYVSEGVAAYVSATSQSGLVPPALQPQRRQAFLYHQYRRARQRGGQPRLHHGGHRRLRRERGALTGAGFIAITAFSRAAGAEAHRS